MNKIVVDTSVVINALISSSGPARELVRQCLMKKYTPLMSTALFLEYEAVSLRPEIKKLCPLSSAEVEQLLSALFSVSEWVQIHYLWRPNLVDEGDNFLIELAVAGGANSIVTNNIKDLVNAELKFENLRILRPEQLLRGNS